MYDDADSPFTIDGHATAIGQAPASKPKRGRVDRIPYGQLIQGPTGEEYHSPITLRWVGLSFLWILFACSFGMMTSHNAAASPLVWGLPFLLGGWGVVRSFVIFGTRYPGVYKRLAVDVLVGIVTAFVVHKAFNMFSGSDGDDD
jgi:hypothetical protein